MFTTIRTAAARHRKARRTARAIRNLDPRLLRDIGIATHDAHRPVRRN